MTFSFAEPQGLKAGLPHSTETSFTRGFRERITFPKSNRREGYIQFNEKE